VAYQFSLRLDSRYNDGLPVGMTGFDSRPGQEISLYYTPSRQALGSTQPPAQWEPGALSPALKPHGRKTYHSAPSGAEFKNDGAIIPLFHTPSWRSA
jgi:hypothetical protein